eukprot:TRINITY_DN8070_c0_g1_i1.p1 TRINITY_DN8070_c0_g1~~TRINITY_DN8070_c0_g1_i1.p1  ORF type:complete len:354 (+),score=132.47 TRINITY_DN8070_c0_g1_i1:81-1142(+)
MSSSFAAPHSAVTGARGGRERAKTQTQHSAGDRRRGRALSAAAAADRHCALRPLSAPTTSSSSADSVGAAAERQLSAPSSSCCADSVGAAAEQRTEARQLSAATSCAESWHGVGAAAERQTDARQLSAPSSSCSDESVHSVAALQHSGGRVSPVRSAAGTASDAGPPTPPPSFDIAQVGAAAAAAEVRRSAEDVCTPARRTLSEPRRRLVTPPPPSRRCRAAPLLRAAAVAALLAAAGFASSAVPPALSVWSEASLELQKVLAEHAVDSRQVLLEKERHEKEDNWMARLLFRRRVEEAGQRLAAAEWKLQHASERIRALTDGVADSLAELVAACCCAVVLCIVAAAAAVAAIL